MAPMPLSRVNTIHAHATTRPKVWNLVMVELSNRIGRAKPMTTIVEVPTWTKWLGLT